MDAALVALPCRNDHLLRTISDCERRSADSAAEPIKTAFGALRRSQDRDVWVGRNLKKALSARHREQGQQKKLVNSGSRCGNEENRSQAAQPKPAENAALVSDTLH